MNNFIENQQWRYATKKFDANKKVSPTDLEILKQAIQLTASSYGLQPYKVLIVENKEIRQQLLPHSWGQLQITEASHLLVFVSEKNIDNELIDNFISNVTETRSLDIDKLKGYADFIKNNIVTLPQTEKDIWAAKQIYLAMGNLLNAAAELKIDVTPMEGFIAEKYNEILDLNAKGLHTVLVAAIGYRHEEDATQHLKKVRKPLQQLFETI